MKNQQTIVDVRTHGEFIRGHVKGSINIPLQEIQQRIEEIKILKEPIFVCYASGNRSEQASTFLKSYGINCENVGSWIEVNNKLNDL